MPYFDKLIPYISNYYPWVFVVSFVAVILMILLGHLIGKNSVPRSIVKKVNFEVEAQKQLNQKDLKIKQLQDQLKRVEKQRDIYKQGLYSGLANMNSAVARIDKDGE